MMAETKSVDETMAWLIIMFGIVISLGWKINLVIEIEWYIYIYNNLFSIDMYVCMYVYVCV